MKLNETNVKVSKKIDNTMYFPIKEKKRYTTC